VTTAEREFVLKHLYEGRDSFLRAIAGLSEAQLSFKSQPDRWSIADCMEHIAMAEDAMFAGLTKGFQNPNGVSLDPEKYDRLVAAVVNRGRRSVAPEVMRPASHFGSAAEASLHFQESRERAIAFARECPDDLRHLFMVHPLLGEIDCYRCLLLLALHPARHAAQIEEIKQDPGFPQG
jgi:hypothetical protein